MLRHRELYFTFLILLFTIEMRMRSVQDKIVVMEIGVYLDRLFLEKINESLGLSTTQQLTDLVTLKWSGVSSVHLTHSCVLCVISVYFVVLCYLFVYWGVQRSLYFLCKYRFGSFWMVSVL